MATDYAADVRKYTNNVNEAVVAAIVKYCGIALRNKDSSLVSTSDQAEIDRVKVGFATKKLELNAAQFDSAAKVVAEKMKGCNAKSRVTYYYLLAEASGTLGKLA
ncbi:MAG: DUF2853 family protein [Gammaproteobacteria bacterium]|nr:DUF2853 family protein [Gammaproteobacteria bacterium]MBU1414417.1 DUF2853 family protein [Gammaproteobacteria bacterium]